jgi:hypothetical protein
MKIWNGYGSEHSMNLVMIGHFKSEDDAKKTQEIIEKLSVELSGKIDIGTNQENFGSEIRDILKAADCYFLSPGELEHFLYDTHTRVEGDKIILETDETEVSAFFKLMMYKGAKVEVYSAHHYPDEQQDPQT